jgi:hypothetical protein
MLRPFGVMLASGSRSDVETSIELPTHTAVKLQEQLTVGSLAGDKAAQPVVATGVFFPAVRAQVRLLATWVTTVAGKDGICHPVTRLSDAPPHRGFSAVLASSVWLTRRRG